MNEQISFEPEALLLASIRRGKPDTYPRWAQTLGQSAALLDDQLLVELLRTEIDPVMEKDPDTIAGLAFSQWTSAITWFLTAGKHVLLSGIGALKPDPKPTVLYEPDPLLYEALRLGLRPSRATFPDELWLDRDPGGAVPVPESDAEADWTSFYTHLISGLELTEEDEKNFRFFVKKVSDLRHSPFL